MEKTEFQNNVALAIKGDADAFARLYGLIYKELYRFALSNLRSPEDAQDAVSEAVVDAFGSMKRLRDEKAFMSWFYAILSAKIKKKQKEYMNAPQSVDEDCVASDDFSGFEIKHALDRLEESDRLVITLSALGGYTSDEIARMCGVKSSSVRSRLMRARCRLLELLKTDEGKSAI